MRRLDGQPAGQQMGQRRKSPRDPPALSAADHFRAATGPQRARAATRGRNIGMAAVGVRAGIAVCTSIHSIGANLAANWFNFSLRWNRAGERERL